jgi:hypothetical protein
VLVFWFTIITAGLNLFAPRNGTTFAFNLLCALVDRKRDLLVLEMDQSFGGVIHVSDAPLRAALAQLSALNPAGRRLIRARICWIILRYEGERSRRNAMASKKKPLPRSLKLKSLAGGAPMCGNPLRFTMQPQQQTQWCWAAVSVSVNLFYHPASGQTQCAVANVAMGQTTCCQNGSTAQCNQPWFLDQALQIVGNLNAWSAGKGAWRQVKNRDQQLPAVCLRIGVERRRRPFRTVYGYWRTAISIADPWYGNSVVPYAPFPSGYQGGGSWTDSYTTRA